MTGVQYLRQMCSHCREPRGRRDWGFEDAEQVEPEDSEFNSFGEELEQGGQSGALAALCAALDRSLAEAKEALKVHKSKAVEAASEEPQTGLLESNLFSQQQLH